MNHKEIILASASPRRKELMEDCMLPFTIIPATAEEFIDASLSLEEAIEQIALTKAASVAKDHPDSIVIGADTMVILSGKALGKPKNAEEAYAMLEALSGKTHTVVTGVAILEGQHQEVFHETTSVQFYELDKDLMEWYLSTNEPFDKAGGYGIQGYGKLLVSAIQGDYYNVMGLPISRVYRSLKKLL